LLCETPTRVKVPKSFVQWKMARKRTTGILALPDGQSEGGGLRSKIDIASMMFTRDLESLANG